VRLGDFDRSWGQVAIRRPVREITPAKQRVPDARCQVLDAQVFLASNGTLLVGMVRTARALVARIRRRRPRAAHCGNFGKPQILLEGLWGRVQRRFLVLLR
jgi:hypothetical protein